MSKFKQLYHQTRQAIVKLLAIDELPVEGKALKFSEEQTSKVTEVFGADFLEKFTESHATFVKAEEDSAANLQKEAKDAMKALQAEIERLNAANAAQATQIEQLADEPVTDHKAIVAAPAAGGAKVIGLSHSAKSTHLFNATQHDFMAIDEKRPWNLNAHRALLEQQGQIVVLPEASIDYSQLANDFDKYWKMVRQDIRTLPFIGSQFDGIFGMQSGVSDRAVGFNLFMDELTQAYQTAFVTKGAFKFEPETQVVRDIEISYEFENLKELERNWIGVITGANADSSPIKLSFIAYLAEQMMKKMVEERDKRTSNGRYKAPVQGVPGHAINGADGVYEVLNDKIAELKIKVSKIGLITESNIDLKVRMLVNDVPQVYLDNLNFELYVPAGFLRMYNDALTARKGAAAPNRADIDYVDGFKEIKIVEIPYAKGRQRIFITRKGVIERLQNKPREEFSGMRMVPKIKSVQMNSTWKEGVFFHLAGRKAASEAELEARGFEEQIIWCNETDFDPNYYIQMEKDDATPSVADHTSLVSVVNTNLVTITNIDDAPVGKEIRIKAGAPGSIQITAASNFSLLGSNWVPNQGDIIILKKRSDGKFIELQRIDAATANAVQLAPDATTADADNGDFFITSANTEATAITDIVNAVPGVVYKIQGGSSADASTIANAGNFELTAAITLNAGVWIELEKSATNGKFYEIRRSA